MFMTLYCAFSKLIHIIFALREYGNVLKNKILGNDNSAQHVHEVRTSVHGTIILALCSFYSFVRLVCIAFEIIFEFFVA